MEINYFLQVIEHLRKHEEIILYGNILTIRNETEVCDFLREEYELETKNYPFQPPEFNADAALWSAKIVYISAQLILYRENNKNDLASLISMYENEITPSVMLSADLCLRFLHDMTMQLKFIDAEDELIDLLEKILYQFHYSGIPMIENVEEINYEILNQNECLFQLYTNRIIEFKNKKLALHSFLKQSVLASMGNYKNIYWNELNTTELNNE